MSRLPSRARQSADAGEQDAAAEIQSGDLDGQRRAGIEAIGDAVIALGVRRLELIAQSEVQGQLAADLPCVLHESRDVVALQRERAGVAERSARRRPQQHGCHRGAGVFALDAVNGSAWVNVGLKLKLPDAEVPWLALL